MEEKRTEVSSGGDRSATSHGGNYEGGDYEYDEAHDVLAESAGQAPAPRPASPPPTVDVGEGGDYGYDEARDFGRR